jgi:hypothetical protein
MVPNMHKGIRLSLELWIEGEDEPARDFAAFTIHAVKQMLEEGKPPERSLQITVRSIEENTDWEEDEKRDH